MRYSHPLHSSKKHHILKRRYASALISYAWIIGILVILSLLVNISSLDFGSIFGGFLASLIRTTISYVLAATIAILIAILLSSHKVIENALLPVFDVLQSFPSFALFPVLVAALKNSPEYVIIIVLTVTMVWPILFSIIGGMKNRRADFEEAATIFGAKGWKRLTHFSMPELMPSIITGSIVGWGEGWEFIIGAELLVQAHVGIGSYLGILGESQQNVSLAIGIVILLLLLYIINKIFWLPLLNKATLYSSES